MSSAAPDVKAPMGLHAAAFDINCRACPRLAKFLDTVKKKHPDYHCRPVPPFGDANAHLLIVGLAPGMHGANRTGRPFTGDYAGILLYETLYRHGFGSQSESVSADDPLKLINCRISNAVKCLPPENKPTTSEIRECNHFLAAELAGMPKHSVVLALGKIAHDAVLRALNIKLNGYVFGHAAEHKLNGFTLLDSYHCSRYNTQTKRLTPEMFDAVVKKAKQLVEAGK